MKQLFRSADGISSDGDPDRLKLGLLAQKWPSNKKFSVDGCAENLQLSPMWLYWAQRLDTSWRAIVGAVCLHGVVLSLVFGVPIELDPPIRTIVPVVLVERATPVDEVPELIVEVPDLAEEASGETEIPPEIDPTDRLPEPPAPKPLPQAPVIVAEPAQPPPQTVRPSNIDTDDADAAEAIVIDPRYKIPFDPFAERAPSALSRVVMATSCARSSAAARPAFCPNVTDRDAFFSSFAAPDGRNGSTYDPFADIVFARSTLERFAAGQTRHGVRSGSAELERIAQVPRHAEGLQNCTPVQTGLEGPSGIPSGLELPLGSTDGIQCR